MSYVIALHDGLPVTYWSESKLIHPSGNWGDKDKAMIFAQDKAAQEYINSHLRTQAELCKVVPFK